MGSEGVDFLFLNFRREEMPVSLVRGRDDHFCQLARMQPPRQVRILSSVSTFGQIPFPPCSCLKEFVARQDSKVSSTAGVWAMAEMAVVEQVQDPTGVRETSAGALARNKAAGAQCAGVFNKIGRS